MVNLLNEKKLKITKQRLKIYNIILENDEISLKDIINKCNNINKSTIYRIIDLFLDNNIIIKKLNNNNEITYEINGNLDKHYIKCIKCHKKVSIDLCPLKNIDTKGYKIIKHSIIIDGICSDCLAK